MDAGLHPASVRRGRLRPDPGVHHRPDAAGSRRLGPDRQTLYAGGEVVILRDFAPRTCLEYAQKYEISFLIGVPTIISMLARTQERSPFDLSALRGIVTMGAPFEKSACEKYMKLLTPNIFNGYGTTETFWNTFLRPFDLPDNAGSAGRSCTDDDVRLVALHPDGSRAEPDETVPHDSKTPGEIIISSPAKSAFCYFNNEEMTKKKFYKGWLYTGDVAMVVEGKVQSLLQTERLMLNVMQRMSGIATMTRKYAKVLEGTNTRVLDTRKTTPGMRILEKMAVKIGGGVNHRIGLFDMILLKDNHVDFAGGIDKAITRAKEYCKEKEYIVTVNRPVTESFIHGLANGVPLAELNTMTRKCHVKQIGKKQFKIILTQGLNRQIRRMCEYFGYRVEKLVRTRIMNIELGDLPVGTYRDVTPEEYRQLLSLIKDSSNETVIPKKYSKSERMKEKSKK